MLSPRWTFVHITSAAPGPRNDSKREIGVFSRDGVVRAIRETG
jgi:hypothetical protein